jgi:UDP-N-acetylglucosamine 2-epimerase
MIVLGSRPEAIKFAPVVLVFQSAKESRDSAALMGQHREVTTKN